MFFQILKTVPKILIGHYFYLIRPGLLYVPRSFQIVTTDLGFIFREKEKIIKILIVSAVLYLMNNIFTLNLFTENMFRKLWD